MKRTNLPKAVKNKITHFKEEDLRGLDIEQLRRLSNLLTEQYNVSVNFIDKYMKKLLYQNPLDIIKSNYFLYDISRNQDKYVLVEIVNVDIDDMIITTNTYEWHLNHKLEMTYCRIIKNSILSLQSFYLSYKLSKAEPYDQGSFHRLKSDIQTKMNHL